MAEQDASLILQKSQMTNALFSIDLENCNRRNNLRIRGLPEVILQDQLAPTITSILNQYVGRDPTADILLERVHRTAGPISPSQDRPRDILCRVHYYHLKEEILRKAWSKGPLDFDRGNIKIFTDVSRRTLTMRRLLGPLLEKLRECGASYRWGHSFLLNTPTDLTAALTFLDTDPVAVPDWQAPKSIQPPLPQRQRHSRSSNRRGYRRSTQPSVRSRSPRPSLEP